MKKYTFGYKKKADDVSLLLIEKYQKVSIIEIE